MGELYNDFLAELAEYQKRYKNAPEKELRQLLLIAIEREKLVTIAYRDALMASRLAALKLPEDIKAIYQQGLAWACKDEEMHTVYSRGLTLRMGNAWTKLLSLTQLIAGAVGGWAASVKQHVRFWEAPVSRLLADVVTAFGMVAGKVPKGVRKELQYQSFRGFCLAQIEAEHTAEACWKRLTELAADIPDVDEDTRLEFERMWRDEERHRLLFELIGHSLSEEDKLKPEVVPKETIEAVRALGELFLPRHLRSAALLDNPLGSGGKVWSVQGEASADKRRVFDKLLHDAQLIEQLDQRAAALGKPREQLRVIIKTTFMMGYARQDPSVLIDRELLSALVEHLRNAGCTSIVVAEGRNIYDQFYEGRTVHEVARYFELEGFELVDLTEEQVPHHYPFGMAQNTIGASWKDADFRIVFSKLRTHPTDFSHLCVGGLQGVGARLEGFLFSERQAHRDTALLMPLLEFPPHFALLEGYDSAADGLVGILGCKRPPCPRRLYAGQDAISVDLVATRHMGLPDPLETELLGAACRWFGDPSPHIEVIGGDSLIPRFKSPYKSAFSRLLSMVSYPVYALLSGRGAAFVPSMDPAAFPVRGREPLLLRLQRWFVRRLIKLP